MNLFTPCNTHESLAEIPLWAGGVLPYKSQEGARQKISRTPLKGTRILSHGHVPSSFPPLQRGANSTTKNYKTHTAKF